MIRMFFFSALTVNIILFVSMIIFCPITVTFVHVLTRDLQNYALTLAEQTDVSADISGLNGFFEDRVDA